jgi:hypothetical protein
MIHVRATLFINAETDALADAVLRTLNIQRDDVRVTVVETSREAIR